MMIKNISAVLIWSQDYKKLADRYIDKHSLKILKKINHPDGFQVGNVYLWIGQHSKVKGKNKDAYRHMFNFTVDSVHASYEELQSKGVVFLTKPFKAPTMESYFATFYDLDNNLVQLIGNK